MSDIDLTELPLSEELKKVLREKLNARTISVSGDTISLKEIEASGYELTSDAVKPADFVTDVKSAASLLRENNTVIDEFVNNLQGDEVHNLISNINSVSERLSGTSMYPPALISNFLFRKIFESGTATSAKYRLSLLLHNLTHPDEPKTAPTFSNIYDAIYDANDSWIRRPLTKQYGRMSQGRWNRYFENIGSTQAEQNRRILRKATRIRMARNCFESAAFFQGDFDHRECEVCERSRPDRRGVRYVLTIYMKTDDDLRGMPQFDHVFEIFWIPYCSQYPYHHITHPGWNLAFITEITLRLDDQSRKPWPEPYLPPMIEFLRKNHIRFKIWPIIEDQYNLPEAKITLNDIIDQLDSIDAEQWLTLFTSSFLTAGKIIASITDLDIVSNQLQRQYHQDVEDSLAVPSYSEQLQAKSTKAGGSFDIVQQIRDALNTDWEKLYLPKLTDTVEKLNHPMNILILEKTLPWAFVAIALLAINTMRHKYRNFEKRVQIGEIFKRWGVGSYDDIALSPKNGIATFGFPHSKIERISGIGPHRLYRLMRKIAHMKVKMPSGAPDKYAKAGDGILVSDFLHSPDAQKALFGSNAVNFNYYVVKYKRTGLGRFKGFAHLAAFLRYAPPEFAYLKIPVENITLRQLWRDIHRNKMDGGTVLIITNKDSIKAGAAVRSKFDMMMNEEAQGEPVFFGENIGATYIYKNLTVILPNLTFDSKANFAQFLFKKIRHQAILDFLPFQPESKFRTFFSNSEIPNRLGTHDGRSIQITIDVFDKELNVKFLSVDPAIYSVREIWGLFLSSHKYKLKITLEA